LHVHYPPCGAEADRDHHRSRRRDWRPSGHIRCLIAHVLHYPIGVPVATARLALCGYMREDGCVVLPWVAQELLALIVVDLPDNTAANDAKEGNPR